MSTAAQVQQGFDWVTQHPITSVSSFQIVGEKGIAHSESHGPCHYNAMSASIKHLSTFGKLIGFHNSLKDNTGDNSGQEYYEYFLSPTESPYRNIYKDTTIHRSDSGKIIGFSFHDLSVPSVAMDSWMIASRLPSEFSHSAERYGRLVKAGMHKAEAFWLAHITGGYGADLCLQLNGGHSAMSAYGQWDGKTLAKYDVKRFNDADPEINKAYFGLLYCDHKYSGRQAMGYWHVTKSSHTHPWDVGKDEQVKNYYNGNFPLLAKNILDLPMPIQKVAGSHYGNKSIEQLVKERKQWSPL